MNERDYFIISTRYNIKKRGITQKFIADSINIEAKQLSEFLNKKRNFSEERKIKIAEFFNTTYLDMLILGRELAERENREQQSPKIEEEPEQKKQKISESKKRLLDNIYLMASEMEEEDIKDIQRNAKEKIEKKRMKKELEKLKKEIRKAG